MEETLIIRQNSGSSRVRWRDRLPAFKRRTDAIAYGSPYQRAAALVDLAEDGVGIPEQILDQSNFHTSAKLYFMFTRFDIIWTLNLFALIVLNFLEKPLWCASATGSCSDRNYYYLGALPYLTSSESLIYEGITFVVLVVHTFFPLTYEGYRIYRKSPINILKVILLVVLLVDYILYALFLSSVLLSSLPVRIAPYIRVVFFILNIRYLRDTMIILAGMLVTYLNVLALGALFLVFSSWVAYVIFEDTQQGKTIFTSFGITLYQMFILFTTSNNPDVWIPAYKVSRWYSLFFVLYILVGVYFVTNLILAVVYESFKSQLVKQVTDKDRVKNSMLAKAFNLLDKHNVGSLNKEECIRLFEELNKYRTLPGISREEYELIFDELDDSHDFKIDLDEFEDLCNAISMRFHKEETPSWFETYPRFYNSSSSKMLKGFVRGAKFGYIVVVVLLLNLVTVVIETTLDIENSSAQSIWQDIEFVFGWLYVLEMALKIYAYGFENYWNDGTNRFDFFITWIIVIGETTTFVDPGGLTFLSNGEWIRYLLLARMLRLFRLLMHVKRYQAFIATFLNLIPSLMPYLGTIFCFLCIYCSLGVQIFGGLVNIGNSAVDDTDLSDDDYLLFNFNDYPNGMVTLFNLLVMGNWQSWMQSYTDLTGTYWTLIYFVSFYLITVMLLLNLVVAFVLEAFFAEMDLQTSEHGSDQPDARGKRFVAGSKSRSQRVDALLHHMLSAELDHSASSSDEN